MDDFKTLEEKKRQKTLLANALWIVALFCMMAGAVMFIVGMRPVLEVLVTMGEGGQTSSGASSQVGVVIGGVVLMLIGIVLIYVASAIKKAAERAEIDGAKGAQMLMQINNDYTEHPQQPKPVAPVAEEANQITLFCMGCGKPIEKDNYRYCPYCGKEVARLGQELEALSVPIDTAGIEVSDEPMWGHIPEEHKSSATRLCLYCGNELKNDEEVCPICGHKVKHE